MRSLETKLVVINRDIAKLVGPYKTMVAICEYGTLKDVSHKVLQFLKSNHPTNQTFHTLLIHIERCS